MAQGPTVTGKSSSQPTSQALTRFIRRRWHVLLLGLLIAAQVAVNWAWLRTNVVIVGWDRPRHLIESLVYNDLLQQVTPRTMFEAWTYSGYYPPLFHWAMVGFYKLFGVSMDVAASVSTLFLVVLLVAAYGIGRRIGGKGVGLLSAFVTSTLPMIFAMSRYTYIEFSLTAMVALSIWLLLSSERFSHRWYSLLFGLAAGLGLLTKWTYVLFVFPVLAIVLLRTASWSEVKRGIGSLRLDARWALVSALSAAVLTLIWYLPNVQRVAELPLGHLLLPLSWFLLGGLIYVLKQTGGRGWNLLGSLWVGLVVAGSWYLPRIDFVNHTFLIAWGRPQRQTWAFGYYMQHLIHEQLSLIYMLVLLVVSAGLLVLAWRALRLGKVWRQVLRSDFLLLFLWIIVPYLVFSFRPSSRHSRFIMPILPAMAVVMAYGLSRIRWSKLRLAAVALVAVLGVGQWLALSFDGLQGLRAAASVGSVNAFAHMFQNQLPALGDTDRGYWVVPEMLQYLSEQAEAKGRPVELALLVNTRQVHDEHFLYAIYTDFPEVRLRELAQNWTGRPAYPQLFEVDYVAVPSANPPHKLDPASLDVVEMLLERPPALFQEAFELVSEYPLPSGNVIYLYEKEYALPEGYEAEAYEALAEELDLRLRDGDALLLHPQHEVALLGRYFEGRPDLILLPSAESLDESSLIDLAEKAASGHGRVATVFEAGQEEEPRAVLGPWLSENCFSALDAWHGPALLTLYTCPGESASIEASHRVDADFGGQITLLRYSPLPQSIEAGEILPLTLVWEAGEGISEHYKVFLHLLDANGSVVAQRDSGPVGGWRPTSDWRAGESIEDHHGLATTPGLIAGEYELVLGLYDAEGQRLPVLDEEGQALGDKLSLGSIQVEVSRHLVGTAGAAGITEYEDADEE
jgi:4-amino-4-deoxy-L-arabinose transferase-like glycosyltransferase